MIGYDDPEFGDDGEPTPPPSCIGYAMTMAEDRQACPRDDIVTKLVSAEVDGDT